MGQMCYMPPNRTLPMQQSALVNHIKKGAPLENTHVADLKLAGGGHYAKASDRSVREAKDGNPTAAATRCYCAFSIMLFWPSGVCHVY